MIFYQVLGTSSAPCCLVGTQVDAKKLARERGTSWEQVDVPTDKAGLMDYVNQLKADVHAELNYSCSQQTVIVEEPEPAQAPPTDIPSTWGSTRRPRPRLMPSEPTVDVMCDMIDGGEIDAKGLSNIAESIAHRFQKISQELAHA